jgi:hypothetical protein
MRQSSVLLQTCSHLANGAKHFEVEAKHHKSVNDTVKQEHYFPPGYFSPGYFAPGYFADGELLVRLSGDAEASLGGSVSVLELAEKVLDYWVHHPGLQPST